MGKSELETACEVLGIQMESYHVALESETKNDERNWVYDKWSCTLTHQGRSATFEFKTGIGHRVLAPNVKRSGETFWFENTGNTVHGLEEAAARNMLILPRHKADKDGHKRGSFKGPSVADVIYSLLVDASAIEETFDDWCGNYGYNNDSLKHLNLYLECQRSGSKLRNFLGYETMSDLRDKEH